MKITFNKELSGEWYADLPSYIESGGVKEDLQMIEGADTWLDIISQGENSITIDMSSEELEDSDVLTLFNTDELSPEYGADYQVGSYKGIDYSDRKLWLCPVTLFVFGEYPKKIFYKQI